MQSGALVRELSTLATIVATDTSSIDHHFLARAREVGRVGRNLLGAQQVAALLEGTFLRVWRAPWVAYNYRLAVRAHPRRGGSSATFLLCREVSLGIKVHLLGHTRCLLRQRRYPRSQL